MKCIRIVEETDATAIFQLRFECYSKAREFRLLQPECLQWGQADQAGVVLAAWDGDSPVSTTRALLVMTATEAEAAMGCSIEVPKAAFPAIVLGRGATLKSAARAGLHSMLRYYAIRSALEFEIRGILGMVYTNAPRTNLMRELGYTFTAPARVWDPEVEVVEPVLVGHLERSRFASACVYLERLLQQPLREYPWFGGPFLWSQLRAVS
jgi:hypothetical protein